VGLNGIYPIGFYPYNIQIKKKSPVDKVTPDAERKQPPSDNADLNQQKSSSGFKSQIDYTTGSVNISQIIADFKNTLKAIGAPKEINEEVQTYLKLVEIQSGKDQPSQKLIKANLANASSVLDGYISETLNKPSRVVKDWIDALLLQHVEYKTDAAVETSNASLSEAAEELSVSADSANTIIDADSTNKVQQSYNANSPENLKLESQYKEAGKIADSGNYEAALSKYNEILTVAEKQENPHLESRIYMDKGYIHDVNGDYKNALQSYFVAAQAAARAGDTEIQAQAHYNMASIYDDFGKTDVALAHYYESLSLDGESDNLKGQCLTLNDVGSLYSCEKNYKQALDHFKVGFSLTKEINDEKGKACILSNTAGVFRDLGMDEKALKYYKDSIKIDTKIGNIEGYAKSYELAGDIMLRNNMQEKASSLYQKSLIAAEKVGDTDWHSRLYRKLQDNSLSY
jgi:tetratricopeptide (TPR) repeat protein